MGEDNPYVSRGGLKLKGHWMTLIWMSGTWLFLISGLLPEVLRIVFCSQEHAKFTRWMSVTGSWREITPDERVVVIERTNIRYYDGHHLQEAPELATIDVSFYFPEEIVLPPVINLIADKASVLALIKPQFEAGRNEVGKNGLVKDAAIHERVIKEIADFSRGLNLTVEGTRVSPLLGPAGNKEFFILLRKK